MSGEASTAPRKTPFGRLVGPRRLAQRRLEHQLPLPGAARAGERAFGRVYGVVLFDQVAYQPVLTLCEEGAA